MTYDTSLRAHETAGQLREWIVQLAVHWQAQGIAS